MMQIAFSRFKDFLKEQYPLYECNIKPEFITKDMMVLFVDYLQSRSVGEGAKSIYQRFKKVIRYTIEHDVNLVTVEEVNALVAGNSTGRVQR